MKLTFKTDPIFMSVNNSNKNIIKIFYPIICKRSDGINITMLNNILTHTNKKYNTLSSYDKKYNDLYIMNYSISSNKFNDTLLFEITFTIPKLGLIDEFDLDEAFKFLRESLYEPYANDLGFDELSFNFLKNNLSLREKDYPHSINEYASDTFLDFFDEKNETYIHREEYLKSLDEATKESVYDFYKRSILNNNFFVCMCGNDKDKDIIINTFNKYFKQDKKEITIDINYYNILDLKEYKNKEITTKYEESVLNLFYQIIDYQKEDRFLLEMLFYFLSSKENDLLYKKLRNEHNLIYHHFVNYSFIYGCFGIRVFFNINDLDQVKKDIDDVFNLIKDENNFNTYKANLIKAIKYDILSSKDDVYNESNILLEKMINKEYISLEEKLSLFDNITYNDMLLFINRIKLTREMIMKSGENHE